MESISNERAFVYYRSRIDSHLKICERDSRGPFFGGDVELYRIVSAWFGRYSCLGGAIAGTAGYGAIPLADRGASAALVARNRARDLAEMEKPLWRPAVDGFIARCAASLSRAGHQIDIRGTMDPHGYGLSLRALFNQAKRAGLSDDEAWDHIKEWALRAPKVAPAPSPALAPHVARAVAWRETGDQMFPWAGEIAGRRWRLRLNEFPEEQMYTLFVGDEERGTFNEWPDAWEREGAPPRRKKPAPRPLVTSGAAAARWLARYQAGEHETVWAEMVSLGPDIRSRSYRAAAWNVAQETMRRARHNVETIVRRLDSLGYRFIEAPEQPRLEDKQVTLPARTAQGYQQLPMKFGEAQRRLAGADLSRLPANARNSLEQMRQLIGSLSAGVGKMQDAAREEAARKPPKAAITNHLEDPDVFLPASGDEAKLIAKLERRKLYLPLSLRAWIEIVGRVDLNGAHPALCFLQGPDFPGIYADPLCVAATAEETAEALEAWEEEGGDPDDPQPLFISFPAREKPSLASSDEQIDEAYELALPNAAADAELLGEPQSPLFVDYLRNSFGWGGFPGWATQAKRPDAELRMLTEELVPL